MIMRLLEAFCGWASATMFVLYLYAALSGSDNAVSYYQGACFILAILSIILMMRRTGMIPKQGIELKKASGQKRITYT